MENFEYSIQLNDRDWAEFYLASEECSLIQAALATAEEPLPSDLEDGEVENRWIRVRVGPTPSTASCLLHGAPGQPLLAEEVLPGSKDETDLGSVSRFLCDSNRPSTAIPRPFTIRGGQSSHVTSEGGWPELAREYDASFAAEGRGLETGDEPAGSDRPLPEVEAAVQKAEFQGQSSGTEAMEKPTGSVPANAGVSKEIDGHAGEHGSRPLGLELQLNNGISQTASVHFPLPVGSNAVCASPESPERKDLNVLPAPTSCPSGESKGAEHPETGTKPLQVNPKAEAPLFQGKPSPLQGHSPLGTLAPSVPPSESPKEGVLERRSNDEVENPADLKDEGQTDRSEGLVESTLKEEGRVDQEVRSASCTVNLQQVLEEPEAGKWPTIVTDPGRSGTLDQHRGSAELKAETQKGGAEGPCQHLGPAVPLEGESPSMAQGSQRSNFLEDYIPYCLASENSPEAHSAARMWPGDYDHFICGDTQGQDGAEDKRLASHVSQDLPEMSGPEMYEYFFTDTEGAWEGQSSREKETGLERPNCSNQSLAPSLGSQDSIGADDAMHISVPEVYEHFFNNGAKGRSWKRLFLSKPVSEAGKAMRALKSLLSKPVHLLRCHPPSPGTLLRRGSHGKLVVFSPRLLEESHPRPEDLRLAVMSPERPLRLALTHRDMCLGFVAFASWAVKTSNLQAPDAWKIVLLANFGTLSAIRYFRRQITAEGKHGT